MIRKLAKSELRDGVPRGVAFHMAKYAHTCDDCGKTFWDSDKWGHNHVGCKGAMKEVTGFK